MKKLTKLMAILMALCLITSSFVGSTLAKYITKADADDNARVAKWGITIDVTGDEAFGTAYDNAINASGTKVVSQNGDKLVAPGTNGTLTTFAINGKPEVMTEVKAIVDLELAGWTLADDSIYFPIVIKVGGDAVPYNADDSIETIEKAVEEAIIAKINAGTAAVDGTGYALSKQYDANTDFDAAFATDVAVTWEWPFGNQNYDIEANDVNDTYLGNAAAGIIDGKTASTISLKTDITVVQVD